MKLYCKSDSYKLYNGSMLDMKVKFRFLIWSDGNDLQRKCGT